MRLFRVPMLPLTRFLPNHPNPAPRYLMYARRRPILTKSLTSGLVSALGPALQHFLLARRKSALPLRKILAFGVYGYVSLAAAAASLSVVDERRWLVCRFVGLVVSRLR